MICSTEKRFRFTANLPFLKVVDSAWKLTVIVCQKSGADHLDRTEVTEPGEYRPIRVAQAVALIQTPHRFRTKRQLWAYSGLALETRTSAEYRFVEGQVRRSKKLLSIRGLNKDHNHDLKGLLTRAATMASVRPGPF
jgi:hypothetical protein